MVRYSYVFVCFLLVLSNLDLTISKRFSSGGGRHSYPKSGGLSGGGSHSYPSSGGLSGGGHGYPSSGGSHGYPSSGGSHGHPSSGGMSGSGHGYPSSGSHGYPSSGGTHGYPSSNTGSHGYPAGKGLSGNSPSHAGAGHTTNVHHHYNYNPPQQIRYTPAHGGAPMTYPVYHGTPPTYVYQYKDSGSKYGSLLAGLALLNLGTLGVSAYALSKSGGGGGGQSSGIYKPQPGEYCAFGVKKDNGDYDETRIDCNLITSFIFQEEHKAQSGGTNSTVVTTTITNTTIVNATNGGSEAAAANATRRIYEMLDNGTLVPINVTDTSPPQNATGTSGDGTMTSSVTTITTSNTTTVTNALDVKGDPIKVTPGMQCYLLRHTPTSNMKKAISCGLLQKYSDESLKKNSASRNLPVISIFSVLIAVLVAY